MNPVVFRDVWDLTYPELAKVLPRSEETLRRYGFRKNAKGYVNPSPDILLLTQMIHDRWIAEGRTPVRPWMIENQNQLVAA